MTQVGPPIHVGFGGGTSGTPIVVDGESHAGSPVIVVGQGPSDLEQLKNVDAAGAPTDSVLVKGSDGIWRPRAVDAQAQRGSTVTFVQNDLTTAPGGARPGDYYVSLESNIIYQVQES